MDYQIKTIKNEKDYENALKIIDEILDENLQENIGLYYVLDAISTLVEKYESKNYPVPEPDPIVYIKSIMEQRG